MKTFLAAATLLVTLVFLPAAAGAQTSYVDDAVEGLSSTTVYVHPEAQDLLSESEAEALRDRILEDDLGPVYIAVLPQEARNATGGDPDALLRAIGEGLGRSGTYAVVAGRTVRAGATPGTPFDEGAVPQVMNEATTNANGDVNTLLVSFVDGLAEAAANGGSASSGSEVGTSSGGYFLPVLLLAGGGFLALRTMRKRKQQAAQTAEVRQVAEEDLTSLGNEIYDLEREFTMPGAHPEARGYYDQAIVEYQQARSVMDRARRPDDLAAATEHMERGQYAIACVRALLAGQPIPQHRAPCFFAPSHGPSTRDVEWAPPGGDPRLVPACEADAQRVERGEEPHTRQITVDGSSRPYWDAPPWYGGWAGGYYGGFGGIGFLQGMMLGSLFGGGWGFGMPYGGYGDGGGFDGGGFGGGDFGGGDFGGGDFGGGDFGGGDF